MISYDHSEDLINFGRIKTLEEVNDLSNEDYELLKNNLINLVEKYKQEMNFQPCSTLSLKDMKLEDLVGQFGSYGPLSLQTKLRILETPSLKERTEILVHFLSELIPKEMTVPFASSIRQN